MEYLNREENYSAKKFISYNKLLFNNDSLVTNFFMENYDDLKEVVLNFDYEKNNVLYKILLEKLDFRNPPDIYDVQHILFYNNPSKGYKKELLVDLSDIQGIDVIKKITVSFHKYWWEIKKNQEEKDQCLVYLINLLKDFDKDKITTNIYKTQSYLYFSFFLDMDIDLEFRLKKNNYYNNENIEKLVHAYNMLKK